MSKLEGNYVMSFRLRKLISRYAEIFTEGVKLTPHPILSTCLFHFYGVQCQYWLVKHKSVHLNER